jgi:formylglycine-generating enzyme
VPPKTPGSRRRIILGILAALAGSSAQGAAAELIAIPGGRFVIGDTAGGSDERPRTVSVTPFQLMRREVTNAAFAAFVAATGHLSAAERRGFGYVWSGRWRRMPGADWRHPFGPESSLAGRADHPVVQVSAQDAAAFCAYHGWRLPSEAEWQRAARGADRRRFPWGDAPPAQPSARANFGTVPCCAPDGSDGHAKTAPVGSFPAGRSPFGVDDLAGNVWEWTSSRLPGDPSKVVLKGGGWGNNPHCLRIAYRHGNPPDIGLDMVGFRCAADMAVE